jgi:dihydrofolate synthase / folylpolyglutamate synthase
MAYDEAIGWVMGFWEAARSREEERALRPLKVPRMRALLERLGSPHLRYPSVLIAGTKGKGSTAAFIAEALRAAGYRTGRYTQPHLIDWRERTWVDGRLIEPDEVVRLVERMKPSAEELHRAADLGGITTYEVGTALTLLHFADQSVDVAVLEVGIGGRLDALNAVDPALSVVTSISFDHTDVLGNTLTEIATEKAGIFRPGRPAVSAPQHPEAMAALSRGAEASGARLFRVGRRASIPGPSPEMGEGSGAGSAADWWWREGDDPDTIHVHGPAGNLEGVRVGLLGDHQRDNATVAVAALQLLRESGLELSGEAVRQGLAEVQWQGRVQLLRENPSVVVDAAHNADSAERLMETVRARFRYARVILVFGASAEKDVAGMAQALGPGSATVIVTGSGHRRAADLAGLAGAFAAYGPVETEPDPSAAIRRALAAAAPEDLVLVTGSVFLAGRAIEVMSLVKDDRLL